MLFDFVKYAARNALHNALSGTEDFQKTLNENIDNRIHGQNEGAIPLHHLYDITYYSLETGHRRIPQEEHLHIASDRVALNIAQHLYKKESLSDSKDLAQRQHILGPITLRHRITRLSQSFSMSDRILLCDDRFPPSPHKNASTLPEHTEAMPNPFGYKTLGVDMYITSGIVRYQADFSQNIFKATYHVGGQETPLKEAFDILNTVPLMEKVFRFLLFDGKVPGYAIETLRKTLIRHSIEQIILTQNNEQFVFHQQTAERRTYHEPEERFNPYTPVQEALMFFKLTEDTNIASVNTAYRHFIRAHHPDINPNKPDQSALLTAASEHRKILKAYFERK